MMANTAARPSHGSPNGRDVVPADGVASVASPPKGIAEERKKEAKKEEASLEEGAMS